MAQLENPLALCYWTGLSLHTQSICYRISGFSQVRVFTFAVGPPAESTEALRDMACNNRGEPNLNVASNNPFHRIIGECREPRWLIDIKIKIKKETFLCASAVPGHTRQLTVQLAQQAEVSSWQTS